MGYVIIALEALQGVRLDGAGDVVPGSGYDLLPDPLGWLLVLFGVGLLPREAPRGALPLVGTLALVVSTVLWFPAAAQALAAVDPSLGWAASLPALAFAALLFRQLARSAQGTGDRTAATVLQGLVTLTVVVALLPVLVLGAGWGGLEDLAGGSGQLLNLAAVVVLFSCAGRSWAAAPQPTPASPHPRK